MNKTLTICLFCGGLCLFLLSPFLQASSMQMPEEILMDDAQQEQVENPVYAPVTLPHQQHVSLGCPTCHHTWEDTSQPPQKCTSSGCHDLLGATGSQMQEENAAFNAFHNRDSTRSCLGCHLESDKADQPCGPFADCADCHSTDK